MSGSDSDLDFESADEDTEFAVPSKNKTVNQRFDSKDRSSESTSVKDEAPSVALSTDVKDKAENSPVVQTNLSDNDKKKITACEKLDFDEAQDDTETVASTVSANNASEAKSDETTDSSLSISQHNIHASAPKSDENINTSKIEPKDEPTSTKEKQRVVLRLEKKMNEKKQKELPSEREKASDLINILHDENGKKQSSWGFSSWGSSLLSSAALSVSTFSNQVSQGIGTVLETVENTLGAPNPEELANALNEKKGAAKSDENVKEENEERVSLLPDVSSWTKALESTGSKVVFGGLDALEFIGKKTIDILTEGDPGLRNKRAAFSGAANLSEMLRELKMRADEQDQQNGSEDIDNVHYSQIFDEKQGLVHLEALEMLSKQSQAKFQRLLMRHSKNSDVKKRLEEIKAICENIPSLDDPSECESFEDFETVFKKNTLEMSLPLNVENIINTQRQINKTICSYENISEDSKSSPKEIFQSGVCSLAEFTAKCIETFHKVAELILVQSNLETDLEHCATNLTGLTTVMCIEVNNVSSRYHKCLETTAEYFQTNGISDKIDVNTLATNLYVEASNSNNYIQDAYQMLVPVLQVRLLEAID
ncbi:protein FAM114A2 [Trichonephila inaurata madagascariensis]|uniref:Protein FAM114A2 n=1 Tax=Trichonephila inaurata madagascariensis TaxID=2747483 RepID=A0A8X6JX03_9ARAC|nr:protein FAM114A2 [Trichonephila inaurata madagascariensis]